AGGERVPRRRPTHRARLRSHQRCFRCAYPAPHRRSRRAPAGDAGGDRSGAPCRLSELAKRNEILLLRSVSALAFSLLLFPVASAHAASETLCTVVADADNGRMIRREGTCDTSVTAASTFKIAISLMGFDSGFLKDERTPELPFREGYADWNPAWRTTTDPKAWMGKSVVWYSQEITRALGEERFERYVREFQYGNQDVSGGPGAPDGLTSAWLSSSLKISPLGQLEFLEKFVRRELPVSTHAYEMTARLTDLGVQAGG